MQEVSKKSKILNYINVFRGLAILLIVMGHTMQFKSANPYLEHLNIEIICGGTALFIFISGFLFQHLSSKFEYKNYLSKKWTNVILPYLFTAIPGLIFCFMFPIVYGNSFDGLNPFIQIPVLLSIGRVHDVPTWFIPMITIFFLFSHLLLVLEKKNILYKLLPLLFLITIFLPRGVAEYESTLNLSYSAKYIVYIKYILLNFCHFSSIYIFGMFCSKYKEIIDVFYQKRVLFGFLAIFSILLNVYFAVNSTFDNGTISKIFVTILLLAYLKHYDNWLISKTKLNKALDFLAKYSFGLFFIHWYIFFLYNKIFNLEKVLEFSGIETIVFVFIRFFMVTFVSLLALYLFKKAVLKFKKDINTRSLIGV